MEANYNNPARHATNLTSTPFAPFDELRVLLKVQFRVRLRGRARHDLVLFKYLVNWETWGRSSRVVFSDVRKKKLYRGMREGKPSRSYFVWQ